MSLSIKKLDELLNKKGLIPKKYFSVNTSCVYIEVLSLSNADIFLLYIPSKYDIKIINRNDVYNIEYMEISEDGNIPDDYAGELDDFEIEKRYDEIDLNIDPTEKGKNISDILEENYNHPVSLKDVSKDDKQRLREIFRQLRRLKLCVQNLRYKICIFYRNFMCCIRRDNTFEGFMISGYNGSSQINLAVTLDLESFYGKLDSIAVDITTVRQGVYNILDKNHHRHTINLTKMLSQKNILLTSADIVTQKKTKCMSQLHKLEKLLEILGERERQNLDKIVEIDEYYGNEISLKGLHSDIERTHRLAKHETELGKISLLQEEIIRNIIVVKKKFEDLSLKVDKICFDNSVMIDAIVKNFIQLSEL